MAIYRVGEEVQRIVRGDLVGMPAGNPATARPGGPRNEKYRISGTVAQSPKTQRRAAAGSDRQNERGQVLIRQFQLPADMLAMGFYGLFRGEHRIGDLLDGQSQLDQHADSDFRRGELSASIAQRADELQVNLFELLLGGL